METSLQRMELLIGEDNLNILNHATVMIVGIEVLAPMPRKHWQEVVSEP